MTLTRDNEILIGSRGVVCSGCRNGDIGRMCTHCITRNEQLSMWNSAARALQISADIVQCCDGMIKLLVFLLCIGGVFASENQRCWGPVCISTDWVPEAEGVDISSYPYGPTMLPFVEWIELALLLMYGVFYGVFVYPVVKWWGHVSVLEFSEVWWGFRVGFEPFLFLSFIYLLVLIMDGEYDIFARMQRVIRVAYEDYQSYRLVPEVKGVKGQKAVYLPGHWGYDNELRVNYLDTTVNGMQIRVCYGDSGDRPSDLNASVGKDYVKESILQKSPIIHVKELKQGVVKLGTWEEGSFVHFGMGVYLIVDSRHILATATHVLEDVGIGKLWMSRGNLAVKVETTGTLFRSDKETVDMSMLIVHGKCFSQLMMKAARLGKTQGVGGGASVYGMMRGSNVACFGVFRDEWKGMLQRHECSTIPSFSGSPLFQDDHVVAIHTGTDVVDGEIRNWCIPVWVASAADYVQESDPRAGKKAKRKLEMQADEFERSEKDIGIRVVNGQEKIVVNVWDAKTNSYMHSEIPSEVEISYLAKMPANIRNYVIDNMEGPTLRKMAGYEVFRRYGKINAEAREELMKVEAKSKEATERERVLKEEEERNRNLKNRWADEEIEFGASMQSKVEKQFEEWSRGVEESDKKRAKYVQESGTSSSSTQVEVTPAVNRPLPEIPVEYQLAFALAQQFVQQMSTLQPTQAYEQEKAKFPRRQTKIFEEEPEEEALDDPFHELRKDMPLTAAKVAPVAPPRKGRVPNSNALPPRPIEAKEAAALSGATRAYRKETPDTLNVELEHVATCLNEDRAVPPRPESVEKKGGKQAKVMSILHTEQELTQMTEQEVENSASTLEKTLRENYVGLGKHKYKVLLREANSLKASGKLNESRRNSLNMILQAADRVQKERALMFKARKGEEPQSQSTGLKKSISSEDVGLNQ